MRLVHVAGALEVILGASMQLANGQVPPSLRQQQEQILRERQNSAKEHIANADEAKAQIRGILTRLGEKVTYYLVDLPSAAVDPVGFAIELVRRRFGVSTVPSDPTSLSVQL